MPGTQRPSKASEEEQNRSLWAASGLGLELAGSIGGMAALGWAIDRGAGTAPMWLFICLGVGVIGGGYNFIRKALALNRKASEAYRQSRVGKGPLPPLKDPVSRDGGMFDRKGADDDDGDDSESGSFEKPKSTGW